MAFLALDSALSLITQVLFSGASGRWRSRQRTAHVGHRTLRSAADGGRRFMIVAAPHHDLIDIHDSSRVAKRTNVDEQDHQKHYRQDNERYCRHVPFETVVNFFLGFHI